MGKPNLSWQDTPGVLVKGHFILNKSLHSDTYFNKDMIFAHPQLLNSFCRKLAFEFSGIGVEMVIGSQGIGGTIAYLVAMHLSEFVPFKEVLAGYVDETKEGFVIRRGYRELLCGKKTIVVDDVATSGDTGAKLVGLCRAFGADVVGFGLICNRGGVGTHDVGGVKHLRAVISKTSISSKIWSPEECAKTGLCSEGVLISTQLGHG